RIVLELEPLPSEVSPQLTLLAPEGTDAIDSQHAKNFPSALELHPKHHRTFGNRGYIPDDVHPELVRFSLDFSGFVVQARHEVILANSDPRQLIALDIGAFPQGASN